MDIQALLIAIFGAANAVHNYITRRGIFFYFVILIIGFALNYWGWQEVNVFIGTYAIICLMRYIINFAPVATAAAIGAFNGAMNEPQTVIGESARIIRSYFDKTTFGTVVITGLPFAVLATIPYQESPRMFGFFIFGSLILGLIIWKYPGKKIEKISITIGLAFVICGIGYPILTSNLARGFGINASLPASYEVNKANIALVQIEQNNIDKIRKRYLAYISKRLLADNATALDAKGYNILMEEIGSRKRLVLAADRKRYQLAEIPLLESIKKSFKNLL